MFAINFKMQIAFSLISHLKLSVFLFFGQAEPQCPYKACSYK